MYDLKILRKISLKHFCKLVYLMIGIAPVLPVHKPHPVDEIIWVSFFKQDPKCKTIIL